MKQAEISIIIPVRNEILHIKKCLEAIFRQDFPGKKEVIVIDSQSEDGTVEAVKTFGEVQLHEIRAGEFGHGKTRNLGLTLSTAPLIVFLNGDAVPVDEGWLSALHDALAGNERLAGVYGRHIPRSRCHLYMRRDLLNTMPGREKIHRRIGTLNFMIFSTVNCIIRRNVLEKFPFCDDILIAEDQCWGDRVIREGYELRYEPRAAVVHSHNYSMRETFRIKKMVGLSYHRFMRRWTAVILGFFLITGGIVTKVAGDFIYILKQPEPFVRKLREIPISVGHRLAGFLGKYAGWIGATYKRDIHE